MTMCGYHHRAAETKTRAATKHVLFILKWRNKFDFSCLMDDIFLGVIFFRKEKKKVNTISERVERRKRERKSARGNK